MVERDCVDCVEIGEIVFVWGQVALPRDNIEWGVCLVGSEQKALELVYDFVVSVQILVGSHGVHEMAGVGQPVAANGAEVWQLKVPVVDLADVPAGTRVRDCDGELDAAWDDCDFAWRDCYFAKLCGEQNVAELRHNEQVPVRVLHGPVVHGGVARVHVDRTPVSVGWASAATDFVQSLHKVCWCCGQRKGRPSQLVGRHTHCRASLGTAHKGRMHHRRADAVQPRPALAMARHREG